MPLGVIEGVAQGEIDILVPCAIDMKAVGVDVRSGHREIDLGQIECSAFSAFTRPLERHMALGDPPMESRQALT